MFLCCGSRRLVKAAERVGGPGPGAPSWGVGWGGAGGGRHPAASGAAYAFDASDCWAEDMERFEGVQR